LVGLPPAVRGLFGRSGESTIAVWLAPALGAPIEIAHATEWKVMGTSTVVALFGIGMAYAFFGGGYRAPVHAFARKMPRLLGLVRDKFRVDEIYGKVFVRPLRVACDLAYRWVDRILIDKILVGGWTFLVDIAGRVFRFLQAGDVQRYLAAFAIGAAVVVWIAARPASPDEIRVRVDGHTVKVELVSPQAKGDALKYGFDFDGDGVADREGSTPSAIWTYGGPDRYTVTITIDDPRWQTRRTLRQTVEVR
jgi:hypothetical protein